MPAGNCLGLDDDEYRSPIRPEAGEPSPEDPVALPEPRPFLLFAQDRQLLSQSEILGGQLGLASKQCPNRIEHHLYPAHAPLPEPLP